MLLSRDDLITTLFRETDRAQRLKTGLSVILCGIAAWEEWRSRLGARTLELAEQDIAVRMMRLLRCYDSLGRFGGGEYGLVLPGCNSFNAVGMAERLSQDVFSSTVFAGGEELMFEASFGIAGSGGRSPVVVLRNAETALKMARTRGVGSIERSSYDGEPDPATFPMPVIGDEVMRW
jgi:diguanylate cyclase (GGDEF)-like protein